MDPQAQLRELVGRVRRRWRRLMILRGATRGTLAGALILAAAALLAGIVWHTPLTLALLGVGAVGLAGAALCWGLWPARAIPSDAAVARFIEEHEPSLDDRLVSAIDQLENQSRRAGFSERLLADAARRVSIVDPTEVVPTLLLRRASVRSAAAVVIFLTVVFFGRHAARDSLDAAAFVLFPSRVTLDVTPGSTKVPIGSALTIQARLVGNRAPLSAELWRVAGDAGEWQRGDMKAGEANQFAATLERVDLPFSYRVVVGSLSSPVYRVAVARPPRVERIEVEYQYPPALGLQPQRDEDGGDIYAPAGTDVRLRVFTDPPASRGALAMAGGSRVELAPEPGVLSGSLQVVEDSSYRVSLVGEDGLSSAGDTEYFIRTIEDRAPEVRLVAPGRDRDVTRLEEIEIEAEAEDDFGVETLDLVYSVGGGRESVLPFGIERRATSVTGRRLLYLEDLEIAPGDFISYYVRARDVPRGRRSSEARSDLFFLQVRPFDQEFTPTRSQAAAGGGTQALDDLVASQKEIIVATWKLDRRAQASQGARSEDDVKTVARAEAELKRRVEQASNASRASNMRDPRRRAPSGGPAPGGAQRPALQPQEQALAAAAEAMGRAVVALDGLKTREAVVPEMEALNHLLKAQSEVKERQVSQQQAGNGAGTNRAGEDLSGLFDRELQRQQRTNYETPTTTERRENQDETTLDRVRELARRQDELLRQQQDLARRRDQLSPEELKRELERLTREQAELSRQTENLTRDTEKSRTGERRGASTQKPGSSSSQAGDRMRSASGEMRGATSDLRRQDPARAAERSARALEGLRETERQLRGGMPDERRRALGEMQLEARQLAEQQRQVSAEADRAGTSQGGRDRLRQLAGEQERLAERAQRLERQLAEQGKASGSSEREEGKSTNRAAAEAARELERGRVTERMRQAAEGMRQGGDDKAPRAQKGQPDTERVAQSLEGVADRLAAALGPRDEASRRLGESLARAGQLQDQINRTAREIERLDRQARERGRATGRSEKGSQGQGRPEGQESPERDDAREMARLRDEYAKQLEQAQALLDRLRRDEPTAERAGMGFTFEGQGMTLSAPGTEAFKQDFSKWDDLRKQATQALERASTSLSQRLGQEQARDRLAAGIEDKAPAEYERQVDSYFKAIAGQKR